MGEVCNTYSGEFVKKDKQGEMYKFPVYNGGTTPTGYYSESNSPADTVVISGRGSIGHVNWVAQDFWAGNSLHVIVPKSGDLLPKFLFYFLKSEEPRLYELRSVGSIPALNLSPLLKFHIPVPSVELQRSIIDKLDAFSDYVDGIWFGLPSEIKARRQQYEYYRDKLLTFKELEAS